MASVGGIIVLLFGLSTSFRGTDAAIAWSASTGTGTIKECASSGTAISYSQTVTGNAGTPTYSLTSQNPDTTPKLFAVASSGGALTSVTDTSTYFDYETTTSYTVVITATDTDSSTAALTLTVSVTDCNDNTPTFYKTTVDVNGGETAGTALASFPASDADGTSPSNTVASYSITAGDTSGYFSISNAGLVSVAISKTLVTTANTMYTLTVRAVDSGTDPGAKTGTGTLIIRINYSGVSGLHASVTLLIISVLCALQRMI